MPFACFMPDPSKKIEDSIKGVKYDEKFIKKIIQWQHL
jgi:hypothetical protein